MARWIGPIIVASWALGAQFLLAAPPFAPADDGSVQRATYQRAGDSRVEAPRRLETMPIAAPGHEKTAGDKTAAHGSHHEITTPSALPALATMLGSLAIVLGLFFGLVWLMRRGSPKGTRLLSNEVVEVLGRSPLGARQQMHVVRFGNKLLLVSLSPGGSETLAEIVDPAEVDRLAGICQQTHPHSATNAFRQVFRQFGAKQVPSRQVADHSAEDDDV